MNLEERMASLQNKLNDKLNRLNGYEVATAPSYNADSTLTPQQTTPQPAAQSCEEGYSFCPECGSKIPAESKFCSECGANISGESTNSLSQDFVTEEYKGKAGGCSEEGIIMTDTRLLAIKYNTDRETVQYIINKFISYSGNCGFTWHLLDIADHQHEIGEATWMDYSDVL